MDDYLHPNNKVLNISNKDYNRADNDKICNSMIERFTLSDIVNINNINNKSYKELYNEHVAPYKKEVNKSIKNDEEEINFINEIGVNKGNDVSLNVIGVNKGSDVSLNERGFYLFNENQNQNREIKNENEYI